MQIGVPILFAMENMIFGLHYSRDIPWILIQIWVVICFNMDDTNSLDHVNIFSTPWFRFQALLDLTLWTSFKEEKENSKKTFPIDVTHHLPIKDHNFNILSLKLTIVRGVKTLEQKILPLRLCKQASTPSLYFSSGIGMTNLSPFMHGEVDFEGYCKYCWRCLQKI